MSFSVATNFFWAGVLTLFFPHLKNDLGPTGALGLFAGFNVVALVMIFLWVPETAQRTLEELDYICEWASHELDLVSSNEANEQQSRCPLDVT